MNSRDKFDPAAGILAPETPDVRRPIGATLMTLFGIIFAIGGPVLAIGPTYATEIVPVAEMIVGYGVSLDLLMMGGLIMIGLGSLAGYQVRHTRTILEPGLVEHDLEQVDASLREMQSRIKELRDEDTLLRQEMLAVSKMVADLRDSTSRDAADEKNALFRLAASLDQLGERVDHKVEQGTTAVGERIFETTGIIEASRDYLQESIEEMTRELGNYVYEALEGEAPEPGTIPASQPSPSLASRPHIEEPAPGLDDLEVVVSLEDETAFLQPEVAPEAPAPIPVVTYAVEPTVEPVFADSPTDSITESIDSDLGLLDDFPSAEVNEAPSIEAFEETQAALPFEVIIDDGTEEMTGTGGLILSPDHPRAPTQAGRLGDDKPAGRGPSELRLLPPDEIQNNPPS
ncbi:MAG: prefoldin subunit 5 [Planctomycetota bacterium]|jgi:prefoldin subunit 5